MKRTVLMNGVEVDISDVIAEALAPRRRIFGDVPAADAPEAKNMEDLDLEMEKLTVILEIGIRYHLRERRLGAGGYRFYD